MRTLLPLSLFLAVVGVLVPEAVGQPKAKTDPKAKTAPKAKNQYAPPAPTKPDADTLKAIAEKTAKLREAIATLRAKKVAEEDLIDVEIYLKAAENIVRFEEWFHKDSPKWTLTTLDRGLERAAQIDGIPPWRKATGVWVVRAYRSRVDGSIQPYAVLLPKEYGKDPKKKWRLDIVLHGRDSSISEAKFIASHDAARKASDNQPFIQLEVYGRGNNAYRWAGEMDVLEAAENFVDAEEKRLGSDPVDPTRVVLRGFSMGGAGTWHLGLHHPEAFAVIGPGAGFTTTHGYIKDLPNPLPDYQEKCLTIYDAVRYAENTFNVPVVAYSGEKDAQKAAADNIEKVVKAYPEKLPFTHLIAPGLEHKMPEEWQAKAEAEYQKYVGPGKPFPTRVHFTTYTLRYPVFGWGLITGLDEHYRKAVVDGEWTKDKLVLKTENVRGLWIIDQNRTGRWKGTAPGFPAFATVDGQRVDLPKAGHIVLRKVDGKWHAKPLDLDAKDPIEKRYQLTGPIDDAFMDSFTVVAPVSKGGNDLTDAYSRASQARFAREWDKWMRGALPTSTPEKATATKSNLVLFGDPQSNPLIAKVVEKLPITWTKDKLVVNGVEYDPKTHVPVLIYPNPLQAGTYVVINSGHTFHEAEFKGTNAQLYPRLGDWAVLRPTPTAKDPAAAEVVVAGLFDEFWKFAKK